MCFRRWQFRFADEPKGEVRGPDDTWRRFEQETRSPAPLGYEHRAEYESDEPVEDAPTPS